MSRQIRRGLALAALVAALLMVAPGPSWAAGRGTAPSLWQKAWSWISKHWPTLSAPVGEKEGSMIGPDGKPLPPPTPGNATAAGEEGSTISPDGAP